MMLVAHPLGNACVRALLAGLQARGLLACYATTLGFHWGDRWIGHLPTGVRRQVERRRYDLPGERMRRWPAREMARLASGAIGFRALTAHETGWASVDAVFRDLDRKAAGLLRQATAVQGVYAYEDGALALFAEARARGLPRCYELPMGYWREAQHIFAEEAACQPEWSSTLDGLRDSPEKLARKDEELAHATEVIVASDFSRRCVQAYPGTLTAKISVVPHGAPAAVSEVELEDRLLRRPAGNLRVLFVGGLTQRKGLSYLFEAMKQVGSRATLTLVGQRGTNVDCPALDRELARHRHVPSLPPGELFALMRQHDVLVLPSLFEGFGLVLVEAMAQGLPIISTPHTAAPDLLAHGAGGVVVPIRSADAIAATLEDLARDPVRRAEMARTARGIAERSNGDAWANALGQVVASVLAPAGRPRQ